MRFRVILVFFLSCAAPALAWVPHTAEFPAVKVTAPPTPDLSDPVWKSGVVFDKFYNFTTHQPAKYATTAYLLYDAQNLYFAAHVQQAGVPITATQTVDHTSVATDDNVTLNLETSGSGNRVYTFSVNPRGVGAETSSENARYAPDWKHVAQVQPNGDWDVVMIIPLKVLRAQGGSKQNWQINVTRFIGSSSDTYTWAYEDTMTGAQNSQYWPHLTGLELAVAAARPKPHADIYGLGAAGPDRGIFQNGIGDFQPMTARPYGIDAKVPLTNTMAFVGTLNPDFSNVEQDQTTIAPQEFQRQYSEYRPFFSQGAGYLNSVPGSNVNSTDIAFYSPKIGVFNSGYKLEGTQGLNSIGLLNASGDGFNDSAFGYQWSKPDQSEDFGIDAVDANHGTFNGIDQDGRDQTFGMGGATINPHSGFFVTSRYSMDRGTFITDPSQADDFQISTGLQNAKQLLLLKYSDIGPEYAPLDGYVTENDIRGPQAFYQYTGAGGTNGIIKSYQLVMGGDRYLDRSGAVHESDWFSNASVTFKDLVTLQYGESTSLLRFYGNATLDPNGNLVAYPFYGPSTMLPFNQQTVYFGYRDGTPAPFDVMDSFGPFANGAGLPVYLQQPMITTSHQFGAYSVGLVYAGAVQHALPGSGALPLDSQWERSLSLSRSFGKNTSLAIGLRGINGDGGFAEPGTNLAVSFHERFKDLDELYVNYGTPASIATLNRFIVKYIFHIGGDTGT